MKNSILIVFMFAALSCQSQQEEGAAVEASALSESAWKSYGADINSEMVVDAAKLPAMAAAEDSLFVTVKGEALSSCSQKGFWIKVKLPDGKEMRVTFKEYAFFVPKDLEGEEVIFKGIFTQKINDVETLRHYAQDAGASLEEIEQITRPEKELSFEATGVLVKR